MSFKKPFLALAAALLMCSALLLGVTSVYAEDNSAQADSSATATVTVNATGADPTVTVTVTATASASASAGTSGSPPAPPPPPAPPAPPLPPPPAPHDCCRWCAPCCPCYPRCSWPCECTWAVCVRPGVVVVTQPQPQPQPRQQIDPPPVVNAFSASPSYIKPGETATLVWTVSDVLERSVTVTISPEIGSVPASGSYVVSPTSTTTYTLTATNEDGTVTASTTITVATPAATTTVTPETSSGAASGTGGGSTFSLSFGDGFSPRLLYVLLAALMAAATVAAIVFVTRKPALAYAADTAGTRLGTLSCTASTRSAGESNGTRTATLGSGPGLVAPDGKEVSLPANGGVLGRKDFRSLVEAEKAAMISREHIRLYCEGGSYYIEDSSSTNGTELNGSDIRGEGKQPLKDGDEIRLANVLTLTFRARSRQP